MKQFFKLCLLRHHILYFPFLVCIGNDVIGQNTKYVKEGGTGDGTSWYAASGDLQAMIYSAGTQEVWVAAGTYYTHVSSLTLRNNVAIYGGFPAIGAPDMSKRNWQIYQTILDGQGLRSVVRNDFTVKNPLDESALLDGFVIQNGANEYGGGIYNHYASPRIQNLIVRNNTARTGGGIFNENSDPKLVNVILENNKALGSGGAMMNINAKPQLLNVSIENNQSEYGGAMYNATSRICLDQVYFTGNSGFQGSAMYNYTSRIEMKSCRFDSSEHTIHNSGNPVIEMVSTVFDDKNLHKKVIPIQFEEKIYESKNRLVSVFEKETE